MQNTYLCGNTIRIQATFKDFNKQLVDPQITKFIIYDCKYNKLNEYVLSNTNRLSQGIYYYDYITCSTENGKKIIYEFYGEIGGKPSINRGDFTVKFI